MQDVAASASPPFFPVALARQPRGPSTSPPSVVADRYRLLGLLGKGGMGHVYRALQLDLRREVALKVLTGQSTKRGKELRHRFLQEASVAARLNHPHAVAVFDAGTDGPICYLAMELLRGESLQQSLRSARFGVADALEAGRQIGSALLAAHELGVLHRDVKPGNIFVLSPDARAANALPYVKLLDFGLAKHFAGPFPEVTQAGQRLGSPHYMAPEQVLGQPVDARCDVFGLGGVLFEMLTGRPANQEREPRQAMKAQVEGQIPPPSEVGFARGEVLLPQAAEALDHLVGRALHKDPDDRYASVATFLDAIVGAQRLMASGPIEASAMHELTRLVASDAARAAQPSSSLPGPTQWLSASRPPRSAGASHGSPPGRMPRGLLPIPLRAPRAAAKLASAPSVWPWTALMGAVVGLLGGASWQHAPRWTVEASPVACAVFVSGTKVCDATPCTIRWHREDVGKLATVRVSRHGFDDAVVTRTVQRPNKTLRVQMMPPVAAE